MTEQFWVLFSTGLGIAIASMVGVWLIARLINNAAVVDVAWSLGFAVLALVYYSLGIGAPERKLLICAMACIWSLRLGAYLWVRVSRSHPEEDGRYASLRKAFPNHTWLMFLGFFELQAVLLAVLSVPFIIACTNTQAGLRPIEQAGAILWLIAVCGEAIADYQLSAFRSSPENRGRACSIGLWRYSRHPNYFFEWLAWVAYFVFALGSPMGWLAAFCPALMLYFLVAVTGIPATEAQAVKSRGEEYRKYQRTTSMLIPWFPKRT